MLVRQLGLARSSCAGCPYLLLLLSFWMVAITCAALTVLACAVRARRWQPPDAQTLTAIAYNGLLVLGFAQTAWFFLVRTLPPVASTLSVMLIPVLGVFSGTLWLGEPLGAGRTGRHWG